MWLRVIPLGVKKAGVLMYQLLSAISFRLLIRDINFLALLACPAHDRMDCSPQRRLSEFLCIRMVRRHMVSDPVNLPNGDFQPSLELHTHIYFVCTRFIIYF